MKKYATTYVLKCRYGAYQVMKKKFAKDKQAKQANLRQRMRELKKVFQTVCQTNPSKNAFFAQCVW